MNIHEYQAKQLLKEYGCPVVPVATNLGLRWPQQSKVIYPGPAAIEFLDPIPPGLEKGEFMRKLEDEIETRALQMLPTSMLAAEKETA